MKFSTYWILTAWTFLWFMIYIYCDIKADRPTYFLQPNILYVTEPHVPREPRFAHHCSRFILSVVLYPLKCFTRTHITITILMAVFILNRGFYGRVLAVCGGGLGGGVDFPLISLRGVHLMAGSTSLGLGQSKTLMCPRCYDQASLLMCLFFSSL